MIGLSMPMVIALVNGQFCTNISGSSATSRVRPTSPSSRCSPANWRSSTRTIPPRKSSRLARSLNSALMALRMVSKPLSLRSATSAPRSAGCSHALELMPVRVARERVGVVVTSKD